LDAVRALSFDYINQQLLFDGFSEVLTCFLPLINWFAMKRTVLRATLYLNVLWKRLRVFVLRSVLPAWRILKKRVLGVETNPNEDKNRVGEQEDESKGTELMKSEPESAIPKSCPMCQGEEVTMPHSLNCGHVYCYLCVQKLARVETLFACLVCETLVTQVKRIG
jgi:hypothetical protein